MPRRAPARRSTAPRRRSPARRRRASTLGTIGTALALPIPDVELLLGAMANPDEGIRFVLGILKKAGRGLRRGVSETQSVLFDKLKWTVAEAKKWLQAHGFSGAEADEGATFWRFRQTSPKKYKEIRTIVPGRRNPQGHYSWEDYLAWDADARTRLRPDESMVPPSQYLYEKWRRSTEERDRSLAAQRRREEMGNPAAERDLRNDILRVVTGKHPVHLDTILSKVAAAAGVDEEQIISSLFLLELEGIVKQLPGKMFTLWSSREAGVIYGPRRGERREGRENPESAAASLVEEFTGAPAEHITTVETEVHEHDYLATLGTLVELKVATLSNLDATIRFNKDAPTLASSEDGRQLFIEGGNQALDLSALGMSGDQWERDSMVLGVLYELTYQARKKFDKMVLSDYFHKTGEETGVQPMLLYDPRSKLLSISGGQYEVKHEGLTN